MKKVQKILMFFFCASIVLCLLMVLLFETNVFPTGLWAEKSNMEYMVLGIMELITLASIPLALRLFKFKKIHTKLVNNKEKALHKWGITRMRMLCFPMEINTLLYYLFMHVAFGYLAIILFLCLFFIMPTMDRCLSEVEE
ncbi:MAG: hypothetical protein J5867_02780 [Prevotella sp.]|nr:hypothetical protein [Prevotella sp.]